MGANPLPSGKEQCGAALRGHACDDISRIRSAYRFQRRQGRPHSGRQAATLRPGQGAGTGPGSGLGI